MGNARIVGSDSRDATLPKLTARLEEIVEIIQKQTRVPQTVNTEVAEDASELVNSTSRTAPRFALANRSFDKLMKQAVRHGFRSLFFCLQLGKPGKP
ncbi:MAG: hypothetical protein R3C03_11570 [Pirellulaceae bacterium]